jgi:[ribosomal protein S5]-alanine N-acetyltransferase
MSFLETDRLWLRTWSSTDIELASQLWGDPQVMAFLGGALSRERIQEKLAFEIACQEKHEVQYWPVFEKQTEDFVGCCGLRPWTHSSLDGHEIGFHLVMAKWGRGFASEIAQAVVQHAFHTLGIHVLRTGHHPHNLNSQKILLKMGFRFVEDVFYKPTGLMHPTYELRTALPVYLST